MFEERISEIRNKLERARGLPRLADDFGVGTHQFRLRPPLPESEVLDFERRHSIVLPDDYRQFLLLAGDGGAGPYYGIDPLSNWNREFESDAEAPGFLASPCPLVDNEAVRQAWHGAMERDARRAKGIVKAGAGPCDAWRAFLSCDWSGWGQGTIHICDQGCTYSSRLIVSGAARGRVVNLDAQQWYPPYFVKDLSFLEWYERWLDAVLAGTPMAWFGFDNPAYH